MLVARYPPSIKSVDSSLDFDCFICQHAAMRPIIIFALIAITLGGCSAPEQRICQPPRMWKTPLDLANPKANTVRISLSSSGSFWNGQRVPPQSIDAYLEALRSFNPKPIAILQVDEGASCELLDKVRDKMEQNLGCGKSSGLCLERAHSVK
jgi:biopolymer transport protein ExbD